MSATSATVAPAAPTDPAPNPIARAALDGIPAIDFRRNFAIATSAGRSMASMLRDVAALRFGPGRLTSNEYYYYRLWEPAFTDGARLEYVGKLAQQPMHLACNNKQWQAVAADKLLFHTIMRGAGFPTPELLAVAHRSRSLPGVPSLSSESEIALFLHNPAHYPLFAKPVEGKYSLAVLSADSVENGMLALRGASPSISTHAAARTLAAGTDGYAIQRRLEPAGEIAAKFGARLWSIRMLVLLTPDGPALHRATAKIPTGDHPADNYWRRGNLLGALDAATGRITRAVTGWAETFQIIDTHPDTGASFDGATIPRWAAAVDLVLAAARLLPGIATQSWDIAIAESGPVILEVNFGGDLNLSQIASGRGTLDGTYRAHLARHGYRLAGR